MYENKPPPPLGFRSSAVWRNQKNNSIPRYVNDVRELFRENFQTCKQLNLNAIGGIIVRGSISAVEKLHTSAFSATAESVATREELNYMPRKGKKQPKQTQSQQPGREYQMKPRPKAEDEQHRG